MLSIKEGEFVVIFGPSGCGKSTLLRIIAGLIKHDKGSIILNGKNINKIPAYKRDVEFIFQNYALFPITSVFNNVAFGIKMRKVSKTEIKKKGNESIRIS